MIGIRIKDLALLEILKWEYGACEITGVVDSLHLHHVIPKAGYKKINIYGDDVKENIICVSDSFHTLYHAGNKAARKRLAEHVYTMRPDVAAYIERKLRGVEALSAWYERHGLETNDLIR